jgi:hypothetical protein
MVECTGAHNLDSSCPPKHAPNCNSDLAFTLTNQAIPVIAATSGATEVYICGQLVHVQPTERVPISTQRGFSVADSNSQGLLSIPELAPAGPQTALYHHPQLQVSAHVIPFDRPEEHMPTDPRSTEELSDRFAFALHQWFRPLHSHTVRSLQVRQRRAY